jgi:drug/metabolite transporter (DMT)-like permease
LAEAAAKRSVPAPAPGRDPAALAALLVAQASFAVFPTLGKIALQEATPMAIAACRAVAGSLLLTAASAAVVRKEPPPTRRDRLVLAGLAALGIVANQLLYIVGLSKTTAANTALLVCTIPVFVLVIGIALGTERPGLRRISGIPVALAGTLLLLELHRVSLSDATFVGNVLIVVNCFVYSVFLVGARGILSRRFPLSVTAAIFRYGALPILLVAAPSLRGFHPAALSQRTVLAIAGIVLFPTVLAYLLNAWGLSRTDSSTAAVFHYVQPLLACALAWAVLGEKPGLRFLAAASLILAGLFLTTWPARTSERALE